MAIPVLTIAGSTKEFREGSLHLSETANGRATLSFSVESTNGSYRPALDAEVILTESSTRIFGGLVERPTEKGSTSGSVHPSINTAVSCVDFNSYAERRYVNGTLAAGTLKSMLITLVADYLDDYGVSLHGSQVDGPALPALTYEYRKLSEVLNELATLTADGGGQPYVWRIDFFKVFRMYQPSTSAAPFNISTNNPAQVLGDVVVETTRKDYANRVIVKVPTKTEFGHTETFNGDGSTTVYDVQFDVLKHYGHLTLSTGGGETLGTPEAGGGGQWSYDSGTKELTRLAGATTNGTVYTFYFDGSYAGLGIAEDSGEIASVGVYEKIVTVDSVPTDTTAQALADAYLARALPVTTTVKYQTRTAGFAPGQQQSIVMSMRNLNGTAVVTDVVTTDLGSTELLRSVTLVIDDAQTNLGRGWRDVYKQWAGDRSGNAVAATVAAGGGVATTTGPGAPDTSVQFNRTGVLGGDASFTFQEEGNNLVCGTDSTITATAAESCFVFGSNCHIADP